MTIEEVYIKYICSNCKNKDTDLCCIRRKIDNALWCEWYEKDKELEGYKKPKEKTAKAGRLVMPRII